MSTPAIALTHAHLTALAVKWLKRPQSRSGPGCHLAVSECKSGWDGEIPDAIGWRAAGYLDGSFIVEVKVSRRDFLADAQKPHRAGDAKGIGNWRFYMCPEGLIVPAELPPKWGLIYVSGRGQIRPVVGATTIENYGQRTAVIEAMRHDSDYDRERFMLVKLFNRIGDPEGSNQKIRSLYKEVARLHEASQDAADKLRETTRRTNKLRYLLTKVQEVSPQLAEEIEATLGVPLVRIRP
jgi:hypothetical protein